MSSEPPPEVLLAEALALLRRYIEAGGDSGISEPWDRLPWGDAPVLPDAWLTSATDLLVPWTPEMLDIATGADGPQSHRDTSTAAVWDDYFRVASESQTQQATVGEVAARGTGTPIEVPFGSFMPQAGMPPAEPLADDAVEAAIECLYDFLHAVARRDVTGAMALVADDYHVMVGDHEIDHGQLRHQIEALLDTRTEGELSVSLARVPQPVAHPLGVLVRATIQFDYTGPDEKETILYERVAVIGEAPDGGWKLCSMSPIEPAAP